MPVRQRQVLEKILRCRTPALGGQLYRCPDCPSSFVYRYHSCNDRHCPLCGHRDAQAWLERQSKRLLLPVPYFLLTFTVPEQLRPFLRSHLRMGLNLLFALTSQALQELAANPRRLGAQLGMLGVLHTWSRTLMFHPHIHYLIPGGGLSLDDRQWVAAPQNFLLHHLALGRRVRTLFKKRLLQEHPKLFNQIPARVWKLSWNVGCQPAGSGLNALRYLARYLFKTATSNRPIRCRPDGKLLWTYRESKTRRFASIALEPMEFMRRFLQHILPPNFARVRSFGWLHPAAKVRANRVRALLLQNPVLTPAEEEAWKPPAVSASPAVECSPSTPVPPPLCPLCHKPMVRVDSWFGLLRRNPQIHPP